MPYSNIVFIKLFVSLFEEDDRFLYQLNESQQLLYVKLLYISAITENKIPKNYKFIANKINYPHDIECLTADISRILHVFPKFCEGEQIYYFKNFSELHNYVWDKKQPSNWKSYNEKMLQYNNSLQNSLQKEQNKNKNKNKKESIVVFTKPSLSEISSYCQERKNNIVASNFFDFYESKGWMVGKNKMKDWKACIRTWENREVKKITGWKKP